MEISELEMLIDDLCRVVKQVEQLENPTEAYMVIRTWADDKLSQTKGGEKDGN